MNSTQLASPPLTSQQKFALWLFSAGLTGLGALGLLYHDFAMQWQPVATWIPGRSALAYLAAVLMLALAPALHIRAVARPASTILFGYLAIWLMLKVPALCVAPQMEAVWLGFGEIATLFTGGWIIAIELGGISPRTLRTAYVLFGAGLLPVGLSHLVYMQACLGYVPTWLPVQWLWAPLTGIALIVCGLAIVANFHAKLAALGEAGLISSFTLLVWVPRVVTTPRDRLSWTAFWISWIIAAAAWCVAARIPGTQPSAALVEEVREPAVVK